MRVTYLVNVSVRLDGSLSSRSCQSIAALRRYLIRTQRVMHYPGR